MATVVNAPASGTVNNNNLWTGLSGILGQLGLGIAGKLLEGMAERQKVANQVNQYRKYLAETAPLRGQSAAAGTAEGTADGGLFNGIDYSGLSRTDAAQAPLRGAHFAGLSPEMQKALLNVSAQAIQQNEDARFTDAMTNLYGADAANVIAAGSNMGLPAGVQGGVLERAIPEYKPATINLGDKVEVFTPNPYQPSESKTYKVGVDPTAMEQIKARKEESAKDNAVRMAIASLGSRGVGGMNPYQLLSQASYALKGANEIRNSDRYKVLADKAKRQAQNQDKEIMSTAEIKEFEAMQQNIAKCENAARQIYGGVFGGGASTGGTVTPSGGGAQKDVDLAAQQKAALTEEYGQAVTNELWKLPPDEMKAVIADETFKKANKDQRLAIVKAMTTPE